MVRGDPGDTTLYPEGQRWQLVPLSRLCSSCRKPVVFLKALDDVSVEERGTLALQCEVS